MLFDKVQSIHIYGVDCTVETVGICENVLYITKLLVHSLVYVSGFIVMVIDLYCINHSLSRIYYSQTDFSCKQSECLAVNVINCLI